MANGSVAAAGEVLAWGSGRLWLARTGTGLELLTPDLNDSVAPVLAGDACWCATRGGELAEWRREADGSWREARRVGFENPLQALTASRDGRWVLAAQGRQLTLLAAEGRVAKTYAGSDLARRRSGAASWLAALPQRHSFVAAWPALGELWEIQLDPAAPPIHDGLVHDYRMDEAIASAGFLGVRRAPLAMPLPAFAFTSDLVPWIAGIDRANPDRVAVVHLDVRRTIAVLPLPGAQPAGAALRREGAQWHWWLPTAAGVSVIDAARWRTLTQLDVEGRARALMFTGDQLWMLAEPVGGMPLLLRRREDGWSAARADIGQALGLASCGDDLLVIGSHALQLHAADGTLLRRWAAPQDAAIAGAVCA